MEMQDLVYVITSLKRCWRNTDPRSNHMQCNSQILLYTYCDILSVIKCVINLSRDNEKELEMYDEMACCCDKKNA